MLNPDGTLKILPKLEYVNGLTKIKLRDEHFEKYKIAYELRWLNLPLEKSYGIEGEPLCKFYAFADTYQGISQLNESRREASMEKYFGGRVGHKVSANQLIHLKPNSILDILDQVKEKGVTTGYEYDLVETKIRREVSNDDKKQKRIPTTEDLVGKTKHTILNEQFIESHQMDLFETTISQTPMYVSFEGNRPAMQIIARENTLFRRYKSDEVDENTVGRHAVLAIGYGFCIHDERPEETVSYVVGQNNWPDGTAEICRFSYESYNMGIHFDVGPLAI